MILPPTRFVKGHWFSGIRAGKKQENKEIPSSDQYQSWIDNLRCSFCVHYHRDCHLSKERTYSAL